jgi:hypothetical protein
MCVTLNNYELLSNYSDKLKKLSGFYPDYPARIKILIYPDIILIKFIIFFFS